MSPERLFVLSPARCNGKRAQLLFREGAAFPVARALRSAAGLPLGEAFAFLSGLYFRGKLAYARRFARVRGRPGALVITPTRGLMDAEEPVRLADLEEFASLDIAADEPRYTEPLARDARDLGQTLAADAEVVLLGSIASDKYVELLTVHLGPRLRFPSGFVGRGDMSRGGLMLRAVLAGEELATAPVAGAVRRGKRPAKLAPRPGVLAAFTPKDPEK